MIRPKLPETSRHDVRISTEAIDIRLFLEKPLKLLDIK